MSLVDQLQRGPVREWLEANFPNTRTIGGRANAVLRGGPSHVPCAVPPVPGADRALVGHAVGYVLYAHLREGALGGLSPAAIGAARIAMRVGDLKPRPTDIAHAVMIRIRELRPWERTLPDDQWRELCGLACVLGRFEQYFRQGLATVPGMVKRLRDCGGDTGALAAAVANPATLADLMALSRVVVEDLVHLRNAANLQVEPGFAQSVALGGADADLIYDGTLLDLKSSALPSPVGRRELWQLARYLLADTDDRYKIERVGFAAVRRRHTVFWPAQDYLSVLAAEPERSVADWRVDFAALLAPLREQRTLRPSPELSRAWGLNT
jgi:hypothetical protein